jgi:hypothetical protein
MRASNKPHVDSSKHQSERGAKFAKGGQDKMFKEQSAGQARAGQTGKNQAPAPGAKGARGGQAKMAPFTPAKPATAGITGPR